MSKLICWDLRYHDVLGLALVPVGLLTVLPTARTVHQHVNLYRFGFADCLSAGQRCITGWNCEPFASVVAGTMELSTITRYRYSLWFFFVWEYNTCCQQKLNLRITVDDGMMTVHHWPRLGTFAFKLTQDASWLGEVVGFSSKVCFWWVSEANWGDLGGRSQKYTCT